MSNKSHGSNDNSNSNNYGSANNDSYSSSNTAGSNFMTSAVQDIAGKVGLNVVCLSMFTSLSLIEVVQSDETVGRIGTGLKEGVEHFGRGGGQSGGSSGGFCKLFFTPIYVLVNANSWEV